MIIFNTLNLSSLANTLTGERGQYVIKKFSDGEIYIRIESEVKNRNVCIVTATQSPAENLIELFLLIDALQRAQANIYVLCTYFGYARQDKAQPGEALSADVISRFLKTFQVQKMVIIHAHSMQLHELLPFENKIPFDLFCATANHYKASIVAPDKGAYSLASAVAQHCSLETIFVKKMRPRHEEVEITDINGDVKGKNILLVDDLISTGNTIIRVATFLKERGAHDIYAFATHGIFALDARERIEQCSAIKKLYVTNTLPQKNATSKITVLEIAPFIDTIISEFTQGDQ